ncbi:MAG: HAMP domain-containing protein [Ferruginibacter sp.]|nr:HAMP domain-containing protein [Ferruginibacter sp.]
MKLRTKLTIGLCFLFLVIITFGLFSILSINRLSNDSRSVLKNNLESLVYSNNMLKALEDIPSKKDAINAFEANLKKQEGNITETGEAEATQELRKDFTELLSNPPDSNNYSQIRQSLQVVNDLNQQAIVRKNDVAKKTADTAMFWLTVVFVVLGLFTFTFVINFPAVISTPIRALNEGISAIAGKNYRKRIYLSQKDEFGELANAFNIMAERLDEYDSSNLAQVRFEKSRIETVINQMKDGIIGLDVKKNILFLNTVAGNLLGLKEADILGKYVADVAVKNDLMRSLIQPEAKKELNIFADGKESYFNREILSVTNNGETIGEVIILRNITLFHELNEAKTNFIATVSHELKTPISSIKMSAQLLNDARVGDLNKEQADLVKSIADDSERLLKITSEILNISQVETGQIQLTVTMIDPNEIITSAMQTVAAKAKEKKIAVNNLSDKSLPLIKADADKTTWVLNNLLTNAIKYSFSNGTVDVSAKVETDHILFSVSDKGRGIAEEYIPRLFERYYQVPGSTEKGTGLGLAISKDFIEAQKGSIWLKSEIGKGTTCYFQLPL